VAHLSFSAVDQEMAPLTFISAISLTLYSLANASPLGSRQTDPVTPGTCADLHQRKAWHNLADDEKAAYIDAELCLMRSPPKTGHPLAQNRWDEFTIAHEIQTRKHKLFLLNISACYHLLKHIS
jgi:hypothetical protein